MLHVFLNPKRNINKIIKNILDNGDIEYKSYFPNDKNDLFNYEIVGPQSATSLSILSKVIFPKKFLLKFKLMILPYPAIDKDINIILTKKISI